MQQALRNRSFDALNLPRLYVSTREAASYCYPSSPASAVEGQNSGQRLGCSVAPSFDFGDGERRQLESNMRSWRLLHSDFPHPEDPKSEKAVFRLPACGGKMEYTHTEYTSSPGKEWKGEEPWTLLFEVRKSCGQDEMQEQAKWEEEDIKDTKFAIKNALLKDTQFAAKNALLIQ